MNERQSYLRTFIGQYIATYYEVLDTAIDKYIGVRKCVFWAIENKKRFAKKAEV